MLTSSLDRLGSFTAFAFCVIQRPLVLLAKRGTLVAILNDYSPKLHRNAIVANDRLESGQKICGGGTSIKM